MGKRHVMRTAAQKQEIIDQFIAAPDKKEFCSSAGLSDSMIRGWIKKGPENMRQPRGMNAIATGAPRATPALKNAAKRYVARVNVSKELEKLRLENLVLRTNLTMAMKLGYLDFLSLESK